jgi:uncharacterized phage protein gp47/JayE
MITIPTIATIEAQEVADIEAKIGQVIPSTPKAYFRVQARSHSGVMALLYRFGAWIYDQIFPQTADREALLRIGASYSLYPNAAVAAILTATATGANDTVTQAGWLWQINGVVYEQLEDVAISGGTAAISVECLTAGVVGNLDNGDEISLATPQAGVDNVATITATTTTGEDEEDIDTFRATVIQRLAQRPQGGAVQDYVGWALEVAGVVKAFAFNTAPGVVSVYPLIALTGPRVPASPKLAEVEAYLNDTHRKPLCASVEAVAMTERMITPTVTSLSPDNAELRADIEAAWNAYLYAAFPKQYPDEAEPTDVVSLAAMYKEAIDAGAQIILATLTISGGGSITSHTLAYNELAKLGTIVWPS